MSTDSEARDAASPRASGSISTTGLLVKYVLVALVNAVVLIGLQVMISHRDWAFAIVTAIALIVLDVLYLGKRFVPGKYLFPGTLMLLLFAVYPVVYTVYSSFTNYGTGNILTKDQAIQKIESDSVSQSESGTRYTLQILAKGDINGELAFLLTDGTGAASLGTAKELKPLAPSEVIDVDGRKSIQGYVPLRLGDANRRKAEISALAVPDQGGEITNDGFGAAFAKVQTRTYDAATNTITDSKTGTVFHEREGAFVSDTGQRLDPGWRAWVGIDNYRKMTKADMGKDFVRVFAWTFIFSVGSVLLTFALGLLLAMIFANERMKAKRFYRLAMIVPYALPSFMTALVWKGMFNRSYGVLNRVLGTQIDWLGDGWWPYISILLVNLWLGFPYMFLICTGALQGIPSDLKEAGQIDGASGFAAFRRITLPLLLVAVAPLLIASFAFNFNNFNIVYLLTEGKPPVSGSDAGRTDILITWMYKVAFAGGRGADYGLASAMSVVIFVIVAAISAFSFRYTRAFEEVR